MIRVANVADAPQLAEIYTQRFGETSARAAMVVVVSSCRDQGLLMRIAINVRKWSVADVRLARLKVSNRSKAAPKVPEIKTRD